MGEPAPFNLHSLELPGQHGLVTVVEGKYSPQVLEGVHLLKHRVLRLELPLPGHQLQLDGGTLTLTLYCTLQCRCAPPPPSWV